MKASVSFTIDCPLKCTREQFKNWLYFNLGRRNTLEADNPLKDEEFGDLADWTGLGDYKMRINLFPTSGIKGVKRIPKGKRILQISNVGENIPTHVR